MRRARWLLIGAVAGIAAYRRLPRLRTLGVIAFLRDVRSGMAEYAAVRGDTPRLSPAVDQARRRYFNRRMPGPGNTLASHVTDNAKDGP